MSLFVNISITVHAILDYILIKIKNIVVFPDDDHIKLKWVKLV